MIFKAIVVSRTDDDYKVYVTIPALDYQDTSSTSHTATNRSSKHSSASHSNEVKKRLATVCTLPGCSPVYSEDDVVFVDFEQDNMSNPIIIGSLYRKTETKTNSLLNINAESLQVKVNTQLSDDVSIGHLSYDDIVNNSASGATASDTNDGKENVGTAANLINRTTAVNTDDTNYTSIIARGSKLLDADTFDAVSDWSTQLVNGSIAWRYE